MSFFASEKCSSFDGFGEGSRGPAPAMDGGDYDTWPDYVHPLLRLSANSLSQKSLEMCTESLGSETGSDEMLFSSMDDHDYPNQDVDEEGAVEEEEEEQEEEAPPAPPPPPPPARRKEPVHVNYHCSSGRSPTRSFPPPLTSICRRDGRCLTIRRRRVDGRLLVEAVPAPSQNYLHVQRLNGRLLLSFIDTTAEDIYPNRSPLPETEPLAANDEETEEEEEEEIVPAEAMSAEEETNAPLPQEKLYFTSNGMMNRGDLLRQLRRCSENRRPLFVWEPCCVASS